MRKLYCSMLFVNLNVIGSTVMAAPFLDNDAKEQQKQEERQKEQQEMILSKTKKDVSLDINDNSKDTVILNERSCFNINNVEFKDLMLDKQNRPIEPANASQFSLFLHQTLKHNIQLSTNKTRDAYPICIGGNGLKSIVRVLQNKLIDKGYTTTRIVVGEQNLKSGVLKLTVIPGYIKDIQIQDESSLFPRFTKASKFFGLPLSENSLFNLRDLEQGLENLKRVPTADVDIEIKPAEDYNKPGDSDVLVKYKQRFPLRLDASIDNSGSKTTGIYQNNITVSLDNPFTFNDLFYVNFSNSLPYYKSRVGTKGNRNLSFYYSMPLKYSELSVSTSNYEYNQTVAGYNKDYKYSGKSNNLNIDFTTNIYRDAVRKTALISGLWGRASKNFIDDNEIEVQRRRMGGFHIGLNHKEYTDNAALNLELDYKQGTNFYRSIPAPEEYYNEGTSKPKIFTAGISYSRTFNIAKQEFIFNTQFKKQWNKTPLIQQDRISIGSRYSVRGFDGERSLSGDRGWYSRNELDWRFTPQHNFYVGLDYGKISGPASAFELGTSLMGAVVGFKGLFVNTISYDLFVGKPLMKPKGFKTSKYTIGFNVNFSF